MHQPITVFYDGQCPICSREVALYRRLAGPDQIAWRNLTGSQDVLSDQPFTATEALELLHVRDTDGSIRVGLDAHLLMWQRLPLLNILTAVLRRSDMLRRWFEAGYLFFTRYRPGRLRRAARRGEQHA